MLACGSAVRRHRTSMTSCALAPSVRRQVVVGAFIVDSRFRGVSLAVVASPMEPVQFEAAARAPLVTVHPTGENRQPKKGSATTARCVRGLSCEWQSGIPIPRTPRVRPSSGGKSVSVTSSTSGRACLVDWDRPIAVSDILQLLLAVKRAAATAGSAIIFGDRRA